MLISFSHSKLSKRWLSISDRSSGESLIFDRDPAKLTLENLAIKLFKHKLGNTTSASTFSEISAIQYWYNHQYHTSNFACTPWRWTFKWQPVRYCSIGRNSVIIITVLAYRESLSLREPQVIYQANLATHRNIYTIFFEITLTLYRPINCWSVKAHRKHYRRSSNRIWTGLFNVFKEVGRLETQKNWKPGKRSPHFPKKSQKPILKVPF